MKNILLVEDEETLIDIMAAVLEDEGFAVKKLLSAEEALAVCKSYFPDLIISDIRMKEMDGFTMYEKIRSIQTLRSTPFIFLTALDDRCSQQRALSMGASAYITKPFDVDELLGVVRKVLPAA
jgi:CheY-like chemotaxis protein